MYTSDKQTGRNVSIDLLKIVAMLMVVILHATLYGVEQANIVPVSGVDWIKNMLSSFSVVAVNCFVLISGYFLSAAKISYQINNVINMGEKV